MRRPVALCAAVLLMSGAWGVTPADARDQGDIGSVSPSNRVAEHEFPPIAGIYPYEGAHAFAYFRPPTCRQSPYCDAMEFTVEIPDGYREIYGVGIVLEWANPYHPDDNPTGNQLTLHIWGNDGPASGGSDGPCPNPRDEACDGKQPLFFRMVEPVPSTGETNGENRFPIYMTVVNARNVNLGYTVTLHFFELDLPPLPEFEDPEDRFGTATETAEERATPDPERPRLEDFFADPENVDPNERPKILVPGADGELVELELPILASGQLADDDGRRINPFVTAGIVVPLLGALVAFLVIRRRRSAEEGSL